MYQVCFYVPAAEKEQVKQAMFAAGAGSIGRYRACCWEVLGQGQFEPLLGSQPHIGQQDTLSTVAEYRVEMVCSEADLAAVIAALTATHPYETPAYHVIELVSV